MIDYINPDVPTPVVEFVNKYYGTPYGAKGKGIGYLTNIGNNEIYYTTGIYDEAVLTGHPQTVIYNCHSARKPTMEEIYDINAFMTKYLTNAKAEHVCHKDLPAFKQYDIPNTYNKEKIKYFTPRYIPKPVIKYIDNKYPISWYPGLSYRYIKYLTTFEDKYEVYFVYWKDAKNDFHSYGKYILYDCKNVRGYKDNRKRMQLIDLKENDNKYNSTAKPTFCSMQNR